MHIAQLRTQLAFTHFLTLSCDLSTQTLISPSLSGDALEHKSLKTIHQHIPEHVADEQTQENSIHTACYANMLSK